MNSTNNISIAVCFLINIFCAPVYSDLVIINDELLANTYGQMMIDPLVDEEGSLISNTQFLMAINPTGKQFEHSKLYEPLSTIDLAEQQAQGVRVIHTVLPTGARSPDTQVGNNGNLNFYGRDYRTGDNFDRSGDCYQNACGGGWDPDGDGIPGNGGGNPNFVPGSDNNRWSAGGDGHVDDLYYEYDYYSAYGANATVSDSAANWNFYRIETDALIKIIASIKRLSQGGYTANYGSCGNGFDVVNRTRVTDPIFGATLVDITDGYVLTNNGSCGTGFSNYSSAGATGEAQNAFEDNYNQDNYKARRLARNNINSYFSYDSEARNIQVGGVSCGGVSDSRAEFLGGNGMYKGHCENDERVFDPFVLKNPFVEIALAPECELFADPDCNSGGANTDLVFAGYRSGFESVSGTAKLAQYSSTGSTNVVLAGAGDISCNPTGVSYGGDLGSSQSICNGYREFLNTFAQDGVLLYGHRSRGMAALPRELCVGGGLLTVSIASCQQSGTGGEGLQSTVVLQDAQGFWSSLVRNDFQWPGQGWAADDGNTTTPNNYRSTLADRDYAGFNIHIPPGGTPHGGQVSHGYTPPVVLGLGEAFTRAEIGL